MKKHLLLCLLVAGILTTGIAQALASPSSCFFACRIQYNDCREIYGNTPACLNEFEACPDHCI